MAPASDSRVLWTVPIVIASCLVNFPAHARYSGGTGEPNDPYQVATAEELTLLGETPEDYDKHFKLMADIDLAGYVYSSALISPDLDPNDPAFQGMSFTGAFDGDGHSISNFTCASLGADHIGLFGYVDGAEAEIKDLALIDPNVDAGMGQFVGSLAGEFRGAVISGCYVQGGTVSGGQDVGGLVGYSHGLGRSADCTIVGCYAITSVSAIERAGGLVGFNEAATISECYSQGSVSGAGSVGGLVGRNGNSIGNRFETWLFSGFINDSYSSCDVMGVTRVGWLVGFNYAGKITRCYSTGAVPDSELNRPIDSNDALFGGLVGSHEYGEITNSFWNAETPAVTGISSGIGLTTAEMQTANRFLNARWDFQGESVNGTDDIWKIAEGLDYPRLWWEPYDGQVTLELGEVFAVTLGSYPSTGYRWEYVDSQESILEQIGEAEFRARERGDPALVGAGGGWEIFNFRAVRSGQMTLELIYRKPWEEGVEPLKTFSLLVTIP